MLVVVCSCIEIRTAAVVLAENLAVRVQAADGVSPRRVEKRRQELAECVESGVLSSVFGEGV